MPIYFESSVSFEDPDIKQFLHAKNVRSLTLKPTVPDDFEHDTADRRESGDPKFVQQDITFLVEEQYQLTENGNASGIHRVVVALEHELELSATYWGMFRKNIDASAKDHGRMLLNSYDPATHGPDILQWVADNLDGKLKEEDFILDTAITIKKMNPSPNEVDISQREALFRLFGLKQPWLRTEIPEIGDYSMGNWGRERNVDLILVHTEVVLDDGEPAPNPNYVRDVPAGSADNPASAGPIIDDILAVVVSPDCGPMKREQIKLLTLAEWPEFKIEWKKVRIKVGCSTITISVPVLKVRTSKLVFYVYFSLPSHFGRFVFKIAETCAIRSALGSSIIGIVTSNIAAAAASFVPLFKRCIEREVQKCIHPGILLLKETGTWS